MYEGSESDMVSFTLPKSNDDDKKGDKNSIQSLIYDRLPMFRSETFQFSLGKLEFWRGMPIKIKKLSRAETFL